MMTFQSILEYMSQKTVSAFSNNKRWKQKKSPPEHNQQFSQLDGNDKEIIAGYEDDFVESF